jgi:hypothetical protein
MSVYTCNFCYAFRFDVHVLMGVNVMNVQMKETYNQNINSSSILFHAHACMYIRRKLHV